MQRPIVKGLQVLYPFAHLIILCIGEVAYREQSQAKQIKKSFYVRALSHNILKQPQRFVGDLLPL